VILLNDNILRILESYNNYSIIFGETLEALFFGTPKTGNLQSDNVLKRLPFEAGEYGKDPSLIFEIEKEIKNLEKDIGDAATLSAILNMINVKSRNTIEQNKFESFDVLLTFVDTLIGNINFGSLDERKYADNNAILYKLMISMTNFRNLLQNQIIANASANIGARVLIIKLQKARSFLYARLVHVIRTLKMCQQIEKRFGRTGSGTIFFGNINICLRYYIDTLGLTFHAIRQCLHSKSGVNFKRVAYGLGNIALHQLLNSPDSQDTE
jgi:hypothetical protein